MSSQKDGVFAAVCLVLGAKEFDGEVKPSKEQRAKIIDLVTDGIVAQEIEFSAEAREKYKTRDDVKGYVNGMVSNWLRKDKRLNGDVEYKAKNPGSRAGQGDTVLTELKKLKSTLTDKDQLKAVDEAIEERKATLAAEKAKSVVVDITKIPEALRHLIKAS